MGQTLDASAPYLVCPRVRVLPLLLAESVQSQVCLSGGLCGMGRG